MPTATNISKYEAADIKWLPKDTVLISINEMHGELYPLQLDREDPRIATFRFADINGCDRVEDGQGREHRCINNEEARRMLDFMSEHRDKNFIVHCMAGIARSSAVCLYLHMRYGHTLKPRFWNLSTPNKYVLGSLLYNQYAPEGMNESGLFT